MLVTDPVIGKGLRVATGRYGSGSGSFGGLLPVNGGPPKPAQIALAMLSSLVGVAALALDARPRAKIWVNFIVKKNRVFERQELLLAGGYEVDEGTTRKKVHL